MSLLLLLTACRIEGGVGATGPSQPPPPGGEPPPAQPATAGGGAGSGAAAGGASSYAPDCPYPDNHCLDPNDYFVGKKAYDKGYIYLDTAVQQEPPSSSGEAKFLVRRTGETMSTPHFWRTRRAQPGELAVGKLVVMYHHNKGGIYEPPQNAEDVSKRRWWMARISSVANVQDGYFIVTKGYKISVDAARLVEGDESPSVVVGGQEDEHFLKSEHWFIGKKALPEKGYNYVDVAAVVKAPSAETRGEGQFYNLRTGELVWTKHAWQTRKAAEADFKLGAHAFMYHHNKGGVYQPPTERDEVFKRRWWVAKMVDTGMLYKGTIGVTKGYKIASEGVRVAR